MVVFPCKLTCLMLLISLLVIVPKECQDIQPRSWLDSLDDGTTVVRINAVFDIEKAHLKMNAF